MLSTELTRHASASTFASLALPEPERILKLDAKFVAHQIEGRCDGLVHVVVLVAAQPTSEHDVALRLGKFAVLLVESSVALVVDGIVRFVARLPIRRLLTRDDGLGLSAELEVLVLDDARPRHFALVVVHDRDALEVLLIENFGLEAQRTILQLAQLEVVEVVDWTAVDDPVCNIGLLCHQIAILGAPSHVRWSYATSLENIKEGLDRLEKFMKEA